MAFIALFPDNIEVFNESAFDPKCLLKVEATSFVLIIIYPFQATLYFLVYCYFYFRRRVYRYFLKVLQFGLFIEIFHQVSLPLKLDVAGKIILLVSLVFET